MEVSPMQRRFSIIISVVLILTLFFTGCNKSIEKSADFSPGEKKANSVTNKDTGVMQESANGEPSNKPSVPETNRKLIRNIALTIETKEFDKLNNTISQKIFQSNGYVENSESYGNTYDSNRSRSCNMVIRIPKAKLDEFVATISGLGTIVNKQETTQDVTLTYVDIESHKKSLQVEQKRLLALLEKADRLEDIITLEQRLSQVRYEIQSYESQLRTYDNQVDYSTVRLSVSEVERVTQKDDGTMWSKIATGFSNSLHKIGYGLESLVVWFVSNILYLIILAGVVTLIVFVIRRLTKGNKNKMPPPSIPTNLPPQ